MNSATFIKNLMDAAFLLAVAGWLGALAFYEWVVRRLLFEQMYDPGRCASMAERLYAWCVTCGAIALPAVLGAPLSYPEWRSPAVGVQALAVLLSTLAMLHGVNSARPAPHRDRSLGYESAWVREARLRPRQKLMNAATIVALVGLLIAFAFRPAPRTTGLFEPSPRERGLRGIEAFRKQQAGLQGAPGAPGAAAPAGGGGPGGRASGLAAPAPIVVDSTH